MSLRYAIGPSGGLTYHFIAYRRSHSLWRPFRAVVREWLRGWLLTRSRGSSNELIVFGPSAGWTLPIEDLAGFTKLTFVEPDPIARFLLRRRLTALGIRETPERIIEFVPKANILPWTSDTPSVFTTFLEQRPLAAVLFANVLGQVPLHLSKRQSKAIDSARRDFLQGLTGRRWASYHDLLSGRSVRAKFRSSAHLSRAFTVSPSDAMETDHMASLAHDVFTEGPVIDHEMEWISQGRATQLGLWPLTETSLHVIGFVSEP